jgi:hypothetical protein
VDPGSRILNFIHPGSRIKQQRKRGEKMWLSYIFFSHKIQKNSQKLKN